MFHVGLPRTHVYTSGCQAPEPGAGSLAPSPSYFQDFYKDLYMHRYFVQRARALSQSMILDPGLLGGSQFASTCNQLNHVFVFAVHIGTPNHLKFDGFIDDISHFILF